MPDPAAPVRATLPVRATRTHAPVATRRARGRLWPLAGAAAALVCAAFGEAGAERGHGSLLDLGWYLLGIGLFALSGLALPPHAADQPAGAATPAEPPASPGTNGAGPPAVVARVPVRVVGGNGARPEASARRVLRVPGGVAFGAALVLAGIGLALLAGDLGSAAGGWIWLAGLVAVAVAAWTWPGDRGWAPRWRGAVWPDASPARAAIVLGVAAILVVAVLARFVALDRVPFGINADEGDRAATAIQIIHGTTLEPIFGNGWYWISMVYFTLLADLLRVLGIGFVQARVFGATAGVLTTAVVTWIGARHFGWRVGLLAGASYAALAVALQFARETTEATPTALCWALSMACFLEAARGGRTWAWVGAGLAGGFSIYFYPSGRLWALLAAAWCAYLWLHGPGGQRRAIVRGSALAAVAALLVVGPFLLDWAHHPDLLTIRAAETSAFTGDNATRLDYYQAGWSTVQLLGAQLVHAVGALNQFHDDGGFWPTDRPLLSGLLAMLTLLGLGWTMLRPRDPRLVALALWFWVGMAGVILTVETPNVQRLATAVPVLAIFPALAIDQLARRAEWALSGRRVARGAATRWAVQGVTALLVVVLAGQQLGFYFGTYGATDRWPQPTGLGTAVAGEGPDTLVVTVARQYHMVNAGWVQLLAPETPRGGVEAAGSNLPLALPADSNLTFLVFPRQAAFLPYLAGLYPGGTAVPVTHATEGLLFTLYRVPQATWAAGQGALAWPPGGAPAVGVPGLGVAPPGWATYPSALTWTARLRVPQYWDYAFRAGPGPARLTVDGQAVLDVPAGTAALTTTVSLARGDHAVSYAGTLTAADAPAALDWARVPGDAAAPLNWAPVAREALQAAPATPRGLAGVVQVDDPGRDVPRAAELRLDNTLATGSLAAQIRADGHPYTATWTGTLTAPATGVYSMTLFAQGAATLALDGAPVVTVAAAQDVPAGGTVTLAAGPHPVRVTFAGQDGPGGLEWTWVPPGGVPSIVPPDALAPPPGAGIGPALAPDALGPADLQPTDAGLSVIR